MCVLVAHAPSSPVHRAFLPLTRAASRPSAPPCVYDNAITCTTCTPWISITMTGKPIMTVSPSPVTHPPHLPPYPHPFCSSAVTLQIFRCTDTNIHDECKIFSVNKPQKDRHRKKSYPNEVNLTVDGRVVVFKCDDNRNFPCACVMVLLCQVVDYSLLGWKFYTRSG